MSNKILRDIFVSSEGGVHGCILTVNTDTKGISKYLKAVDEAVKEHGIYYLEHGLENYENAIAKNESTFNIELNTIADTMGVMYSILQEDEVVFIPKDGINAYSLTVSEGDTTSLNDNLTIKDSRLIKSDMCVLSRDVLGGYMDYASKGYTDVIKLIKG